MRATWVKSLLVAVFSVFSFYIVQAQEQHSGETPHQDGVHKEGIEEEEGKNKFDAKEVIFGHVLDAHEFHFFSYTGKDGKAHHATLPLPVILYSPQKGLSVFSSSRFDHGHQSYEGYKVVGNAIEPVDPNVTVYDFSLTRNVVQMLIALTLLVLIMSSIAKKYQRGQGVKTAPSGFQNAVEPIITFVRDDIAKPNLGRRYRKYMPYLLTVFFFILINNIFGLVPGMANVTGNIAFTIVLGVIAFIIILFSTNSHFWGHIFNPPVPMGVKPILVLVEFLSIFTKPFSLIIRLFANMLAGHIIIICLISLIFIFGSLSRGVGWAFSPISIAFTIFIYFIEILVSFLQAYIFTALTAVFIGQSLEGSHDDADTHVPTEPVVV
ncbi:MAG: F0F1 ATP synthase subunit A [Chitinophagaceae bacterium]